MASSTYVYHYFDQSELYINLTNRCTNRCEFCIRYTSTGVKDEDLWLEREPSVEEVEDALILNNFYESKEIVFCGYGEPTLRYEEMLALCRFIRENNPNAKIRVNTNGHGNQAAGMNICELFEGLIDEISISLNAPDAKRYHEICHCVYGTDGFEIMLDFAKEAKKYVPSVVLSVVDVISKEDIAACRQIADQIGVKFRVRQFSE